jgi:hypothetical protein
MKEKVGTFVVVSIIIAVCCAPTILLIRLYEGRFEPLIYWPGSFALAPFWHWVYGRIFKGLNRLTSRLWVSLTS